MDDFFSGKKLEELDLDGFLGFLDGISSEEKAKFDKKIIKTDLKIYGITAKQLTAIYKYFHKNGYKNVLSFPNETCYEISILKARLVLNDRSLDFCDKARILSDWILVADSWAHTDCVFSGYVPKPGEKEVLLSFAKSLVTRNKEFEIRFGVIILLNYFLSAEYVGRTFDILKGIEYGRYYYVDMAVAWLCATALIDFEEETLAFLSEPIINDFTYKKSLQKARESYRIPAEKKIYYKSLSAKNRR